MRIFIIYIAVILGGVVLLHSSDADSLYQLGIKEFSMGNYKSSIELFNESLDKFNYHENLKGKALCFNALGLVHQELKEYDEAITYYQISINIKKDLNDTIGLAKSLLNIAKTYYLNTDYLKSLESSRYTYNLINGIDSTLTVKSLSNIGLLFLDSKNFDVAMKYFKRALVLIDDETDASELYNNMGVALMELGLYSEAKSYFQKALVLNKNRYGQSKIILYYSNLANLYIRQNNVDSSKYYAKLAYDFSTKSNSDNLMNYSLFLLSEVEVLKGNYRAAISHLDKVLESIESLENNFFNLDVLDSLSNYYLKVGDYKKSIALRNQYTSLKDDLDKNNFQNLILGYDFIDKPKDEKEVLAQIANYGLLAIIIGLLTLLVIILFILYYINMNKKMKNVYDNIIGELRYDLLDLTFLAESGKTIETERLKESVKDIKVSYQKLENLKIFNKFQKERNN